MKKDYFSIPGMLLAASATLCIPSYTSASTEFAWNEVNAIHPLSVKASTGWEIDNGKQTPDIMRRLEMRQLFSQRLNSKSIVPDKHIWHSFTKMAEACSRIPYNEVFADYSSSTNAIRIDMLTEDGFLIMVRKYVDEEEDEIAFSLARKGEVYLADVSSLSSFWENIIKYRKAAGI